MTAAEYHQKHVVLCLSDFRNRLQVLNSKMKQGVPEMKLEEAQKKVLQEWADEVLSLSEAHDGMADPKILATE